MTATQKPPAMFVAVVEPTAFIKIPGRANFASSVDFKTLVMELRGRAIHHFILDLSDCITMDSTFLGVLAGLVLGKGESVENAAQLRLELLNPNARIADLLDNLGVVHLFNILHQQNPCTAVFEAIQGNGGNLPKAEMSRNCLEAHETLMKLNPENVPKFKEVAQFLAEDLRKCREQGE